MLLNEFLKEHRRVEEQRNYFEAKIVQQQKQIEALTATVQKVSNQLELNKADQQVVATISKMAGKAQVRRKGLTCAEETSQI